MKTQQNQGDGLIISGPPTPGRKWVYGNEIAGPTKDD